MKVIHNASIMNAVGACGLQLYRYGEAVSIVFFTGLCLWGELEGVRLGGLGGLGCLQAGMWNVVTRSKAEYC